MTRSKTPADPVARAARHRRWLVFSFVAIVGGAILLPLAGYVGHGAAVAVAADGQGAGPQHRKGPETNPRADYWREVRQGVPGYTAASGPYTTNVLVQNGGENWRQIRNGPLANIAPWVLAGVLGLIMLYFLMKGTRRVDPPSSGVMVERWSLGERVMHWYTAILFVILALTGLSLLFGRAVLIPVLGYQGFSAWANIAITLHNYLGPFFIIGVLLIVIVWLRYNIFRSYDWAWLAKAGGMFGKGKEHLPAGRANAGEKVWFWIIATLGLVGVCVTGLVLDFPIYGQDRETMQLMSLLHGAFAVLWIAIALGHIYLGTLGVEGAFQGMTSGKVSREWMQQHHDKWYEEMGHQDTVAAPRGGSTAPSGSHAR